MWLYQEMTMKKIFRSTFIAAALLSLPMIGIAQDETTEAPAAGGKAHGRFKEKFKAADTNGDRKLSKEEMQKGMPRLAEHFDEIDSNHDGQVTPAEMKTFIKAKKAQRDKGGADE
jgi:hypothetical protein